MLIPAIFKLKKSIDDYSSIICETCDNELRNIQAYRKELIEKQLKLNKFVSDAKFSQLKKEQNYSSDESECQSDEIEGFESDDEDIEECEMDEDDGEEERFEKYKVKRCKSEILDVFLIHLKSFRFRLL